MSFIFRTFIAVLTVFYCSTDPLPPPTDLTYRQLSPITVYLNWSWQRPSTLPENCRIEYEVRFLENLPTRTPLTSIEDCCLKKDMSSCPWIYTVQTVTDKPCHGWTPSTPVIINVSNQRPRVVKDFRCLFDISGMNCSWIPEYPSLDLKLLNCNCEDYCKPVEDCDQPYSSGIRNGCFIKGVKFGKNVHFLVNSTKGQDIIKPTFGVPSPQLSITGDKQQLSLSWTPPQLGDNGSWIYELCYTECSIKRPCQNITSASHRINYDENCMYTFRSRVMTDIKYYLERSSDWREVKYGTTKPPDATLTVITIVIPIILCICVIVSCYCFRKHRDIICPNTPDPSAIFKEMMLSGSKEHETQTESLYTPVPEDVERCRICHINENSGPTETS